MTPITPEIIGAGIEEEYAEALAAIGDARIALGRQRPPNDVLLNMAGGERCARRLAIPIDKSFVGTILSLVGSSERSRYPGFGSALGGGWWPRAMPRRSRVTCRCWRR